MEKETNNTSAELDRKLVLFFEKNGSMGSWSSSSFRPKNLYPDKDKGKVCWQNAGEVGKNYRGSGSYQAYVYVPNSKEYVKLGVAFVHYGAKTLGEVVIPSAKLLEMNDIDLAIKCDIDEYYKKAHLKMDETNTAKLKEYLRSSSL